MTDLHALLELRDVHAGYSRVHVLRGVSLKICQGESVAVLGANGAGKSTLIRAMTGFANVTQGDIMLAGDSVRGKRPHEIAGLGVAQVPEGRRLFSSLSVMSNLEIAFYTRRRQLAPARQAELLDEAFSLFPRLHERRTQIARSLSGGEQQMLSIARTLLLEPKFLLLDEPSTGLAPILVDAIFDAIARLSSELDVGLLVVEQNAQAALDIAGRGYVLRSGQVVVSGTSQELAAEGLIRSAYLGSAAGPE